MSAHRMSFAETFLLALRLVPAERTESPQRLCHTFSAVGLRHWLRLQINSKFMHGLAFTFCSKRTDAYRQGETTSTYACAPLSLQDIKISVDVTVCKLSGQHYMIGIVANSCGISNDGDEICQKIVEPPFCRCFIKTPRKKEVVCLKLWRYLRCSLKSATSITSTQFISMSLKN